MGFLSGTVSWDVGTLFVPRSLSVAQGSIGAVEPEGSFSSLLRDAWGNFGRSILMFEAPGSNVRFGADR